MMQRKKWFREFPYFGWIGLTLLFLVGTVSLYHYEKQKYTPEHLAGKVQKHFNKEEAIVYVDALSGFFQKNNQDSTVIEEQQSYKWLIIKDGEIVNWNTTAITLPSFLKENPDSFKTGGIVRLNHRIYYLRSWRLGKEDKNAFALSFIPIVYDFDIKNEYFQPRFAASPIVPASTTINDSIRLSQKVIYNNAREPAFTLNFKENTERSFRIGTVLGLLTFGFLACLAIIVHKICISLSRRYHPMVGWLALFLFVLAFIGLRLFLGLPLGYMNTNFFSPKLLSSNELVNSFGDLVLLSLLSSWLAIFFLGYVPMRSVRINNQPLSFVLGLLATILLVAVLFLVHADWIFKLLVDSKISFEVSDFSKLSSYTFFGIAVLAIITVNIIFILSIIIEVLRPHVPRRVFRYLLVGLLGVVWMYYLRDRESSLFYAIVLFSCMAGMVLLDAIGLPMQLLMRNQEVGNSSHTYVWFIILCSWISGEIFYFNYSNEKDLRKIFANKQEQRDDPLVSFAFEDLKTGVQQDEKLKAFLSNGNPKLRPSFDKRIVYRYLTGPLSRYEAKIYYYDKDGTAFPNQDTLDRIAQGKLSNGDEVGELINIEDPMSNSVYWAKIPVVADEEGGDTLGYLGLIFQVNRRPAASYTTSLLQQNYNPLDQHYFDQYSYAVYKNANLWTQGGTNTFPFRSPFPTEGEEYEFREDLFQSTLLYRPKSEQLIEVVYNRNMLTSAISLFSYVLAVLFLIWGLLFLLTYFVFHPVRGQTWRRRRLNLTIRTKVNLTILLTVFLSLLVVGVITVSFLEKKYKESQQRNLKNLMFYFSQNIVHFIEDNKLDLRVVHSDSMVAFPELNYRLNALSAEQAVDINLYNPEGRLIATSQSEMLQKDFLSDLMDRSVFINLRAGASADRFVTESIGSLDYESLYLPLRNRKDEIIAYLNLPYYASAFELREEISNILATLLNIYTLIFFLSGLSAVLISNSIIRTFKLLIRQFRTVRLQHNVLLNWPYRDELSLLVQEYNSMIMKVEDMATKLANSEREAAWRELALQVAHEIKNPLTPMKLNIQYLQNAVKAGRTDISDLTSRITTSLIEEIENLNVIASEFAHFAKMPEAKPERFEVGLLLRSVIELFQSKESFTLSLNEDSEPIFVIMDKGYFRRIFTNLIKNAIQAIPEDKEGVIEVSYKMADNKVFIVVQDNGVGIDAEMEKRMFTPYFTTKSSGTGIGLSMCKKMVEHSHGRIWFETELGVGTRFFVQFPVV